MKKLSVLFLLATTINFLSAQEKFELGISINTGIYFAEQSNNNSYNIAHGLQAGAGLFANYCITEKTKIGFGLEYNNIQTFESSFYSPVPIVPVLHTFEIPFHIQQQLYKNWFANAGVSGSFHTNTVNTTNGEIGIFGRWNLGGGIKFKKLAVSINYEQNFKTQTIVIESVPSGSVSFSEYKRKVLYLKLEYPLWNF